MLFKSFLQNEPSLSTQCLQNKSAAGINSFLLVASHFRVVVVLQGKLLLVRNVVVDFQRMIEHLGQVKPPITRFSCMQRLNAVLIIIRGKKTDRSIQFRIVSLPWTPCTRIRLRRFSRQRVVQLPPLLWCRRTLLPVVLVFTKSLLSTEPETVVSNFYCFVRSRQTKNPAKNSCSLRKLQSICR